MASQSARSRLVTPDDYEEVWLAIHAANAKLQSSGRKAHATALDAVKAAEFLLEDNPHSYIVNESFFVAYIVDTPWYSQDLFLGELMVIRIAPGGCFDDVTNFLEAEAKRLSCKWVVTGTMLSPSDAGLAAMYKRRGYNQSLIQLVKELP